MLENTTAPKATSGLSIRGASRTFTTPEGEPVQALQDVSLEIARGEFFVLLGPSGCGKTTLLRSLAGLEVLDAGEIFLDGVRVDQLPPYKRPVNTVFQSYALFPHLSVAENIAFGLEMERKSKTETKKRVDEMLELVQLSGYASRKPAQLSGGQQQRVALARALAKHPQVLLLDEPLAALDLKLRRGMQLELKELQRATGITFVFVTHDQEEALSMGDRIAVFTSGMVAQVGTPEEIYERPTSRFVADFIGETNFLTGEVLSPGRITLAQQEVELSQEAAQALPASGTVTVAIRPERIFLSETADQEHVIARGEIAEIIYMGTDVRCTVRLADGTLVHVRIPPPFDHAFLRPQATVTLAARPASIRPVHDEVVA